jgi:hypothetical protein
MNKVRIEMVKKRYKKAITNFMINLLKSVLYVGGLFLGIKWFGWKLGVVIILISIGVSSYGK